MTHVLQMKWRTVWALVGGKWNWKFSPCSCFNTFKAFYIIRSMKLYFFLCMHKKVIFTFRETMQTYCIPTFPIKLLTLFLNKNVKIIICKNKTKTTVLFHSTLTFSQAHSNWYIYFLFFVSVFLKALVRIPTFCDVF